MKQFILLALLTVALSPNAYSLTSDHSEPIPIKEEHINIAEGDEDTKKAKSFEVYSIVSIALAVAAAIVGFSFAPLLGVSLGLLAISFGLVSFIRLKRNKEKFKEKPVKIVAWIGLLGGAVVAIFYSVVQAIYGG